MQMIINLILMSLAVLVTTYVTPGVMISDWLTLIITAVVLGVLNAFVKPVLILLTLPVTIITLGLFILVINALIVLFASYVVPGFYVNNFWSALLFSIILSLVVTFLHSLSK